MTAIIPWRLKRLVSDRAPLLFHLFANRGFGGNSGAYWDAELKRTWDAPARDWPTRNGTIRSFCKTTDAILDVGCGTGTTLRHLKAHGYKHLRGVDISRYAVERLKQEGIEAYHGSILMLPFDENTFDVVVVAQLLEHILRQRKSVAEICRVLRPKGRALIFVPDNSLGPMDEVTPVRKYTIDQHVRLLGRSLRVTLVRTIRDANHEVPFLFAVAEKHGR